MADAPSRVWWVNQGIDLEAYEHDRSGRYLWAPTSEATGRKVRARERLQDMAVGDITVHYVRMLIRDIGRVFEPASLGIRPYQDLEYHDKEGRLVRVHYFPLDRPIHRNEIPLERRSMSGPFNKDGNVQRGFILPVDPAFAKWLRETFRDRWPADSPWGRY